MHSSRRTAKRKLSTTSEHDASQRTTPSTPPQSSPHASVICYPRLNARNGSESGPGARYRDVSNALLVASGVYTHDVTARQVRACRRLVAAGARVHEVTASRLRAWIAKCSGAE